MKTPIVLSVKDVFILNNNVLKYFKCYFKILSFFSYGNIFIFYTLEQISCMTL